MFKSRPSLERVTIVDTQETRVLEPERNSEVIEPMIYNSEQTENWREGGDMFKTHSWLAVGLG